MSDVNMAREVTRIVAPFWPGPGVYLNLTRIMARPWAIPDSERKVAQKRT